MQPPSYLAEAKEKVDSAVAVAEARVRPETEIEEVLRDASAIACEALRRFSNDDEHWNRVSHRSGGLVAIREILKTRHFELRVLPATERALERFGFRPPEEAKKIVSEAYEACHALAKSPQTESSLELSALAQRARDAVKKLANVTCDLARKLHHKAESQQARKKWRDRATAFLKFVSGALVGAMLSHAVDDLSWQNQSLTPPGRASAEIATAKLIEDKSDAGVRQAEIDGWFP